MKSLIEHLERMAKTLDGVDEENWIDTPQDIAQIYRSVANEIREKMSASINAAKMREALEAALPIMRACPFTHYDTVEVDKVIGKMEAALAKPPRNCDVFEGHTVEDEFEKAMGYPPSETADERDELMRENWFLFKLWLFAEAKGEK